MADSRSDTRSRLEDLADVALRILPEMYDDATGLFSHKTLLEGGRYVNRRPSPFYSTTSLIGILQQRRTSPDGVVPVGRALDALHSATAVDAGPAILGNLVWLCTLAGDSRGASLVSRLLDSVEPPRRAGTDVALVLYGLVAAAGAYPEQRDRCMQAAQACAQEILGRFSPSSDLFGGTPISLRPTRAWAHQGITSFAAQVYSLHGLAAYYGSTGENVPAELGRVGDRLVDAQGSFGQWWWLYYPSTGAVLEGYPVYSVHQDGMAFLGLSPLERLGVGSYGHALALGLDWLFGKNELSTDLVEREPAFIPRNIQRKGSDADGLFGLSRAGNARVLARSLRPRAREDTTAATPEQLEVLRECRSYHLGWLLYAHALTSA